MDRTRGGSRIEKIQEIMGHSHQGDRSRRLCSSGGNGLTTVGEQRTVDALGKIVQVGEEFSNCLLTPLAPHCERITVEDVSEHSIPENYISEKQWITEGTRAAWGCGHGRVQATAAGCCPACDRVNSFPFLPPCFFHINADSSGVKENGNVLIIVSIYIRAVSCKRVSLLSE